MQRYIEIAALFFRLGLTAFGGPAVHIGMMEDEFVERRGWLSRQHSCWQSATNSTPPGSCWAAQWQAIFCCRMVNRPIPAPHTAVQQIVKIHPPDFLRRG